MKKQWQKLWDIWSESEHAPRDRESLAQDYSDCKHLAEKGGAGIIEQMLARRLTGKGYVVSLLPTGRPRQPQVIEDRKKTSSFFEHVRRAESVMYRLGVVIKNDPHSIDFDREADKLHRHYRRALKLHQPQVMKEKRAFDNLNANIVRFINTYQDYYAASHKDNVHIPEYLLAAMDEGSGLPNLDSIERSDEDIAPGESLDAGYSKYLHYHLGRPTTTPVRSKSWPVDSVPPSAGRGGPYNLGSFFDPECLAESRARKSYDASRVAWNKLHGKSEEDYMNNCKKPAPVKVLEGEEKERAFADYLSNLADKQMSGFIIVKGGRNG